MSSSSSSPSSKRFFKVIVCPTLRDHKLKIPDKFVKTYGDELSDIVRLMVPTGGNWSVKVEKIDKTIWLHDGMQKFMEDQSIRLGYFLIFKYKGNSTFQIRIFDISTLEIEYPNSSDSASLEDDYDSARPNDPYQVPVSAQDEDDDDGHYDKSGDGDDDDDSSLEILGSSVSSELTSGNKRRSTSWGRKRSYLTRSKKPKNQDDGGIKATGSKRKNSPVTYKSTGSEISPKPVEVHENPTIQVANIPLPPVYSVTLKPYNLAKNILYLPKEFAKTYMSFRSKFIKLQDADNIEWEVRCCAAKGMPCSLAKGWKDFVKAKKLMEGDVCTFEPVRINEKVKLKVKIARRGKSLN